MKLKKNLKSKMLLYILVVSSLIYIAALGYVSLKLNKIAFSDAQKIADLYAGKYANYTKSDLNVDIDMARATAQAIQGYENIKRNDRKEIYTEILENLIKENPNFLSSWITWEMNALYPEWDKPYGRERLTYYRLGGQIKYKEEIVDTIAGFNKGAYYDAMENKEELVMDPYFFSYKEDEEQILETSVAVPILNKGKFIGLAGFDIGMARFQELINTIHPLKDSYAFLISNNGTFVAHPNINYTGKTLEELDFDSGLLKKIQSGDKFSYMSTDKNNRKYYISQNPVFIGKSSTPWSFAFAVPVDVIMAEAKATLKRTVFVGFIGLILLALVVLFIATTISNPIVKTTKILGNLAEGDIDKSKKLDIKTGDEIGEMSNSVNILIDGLNKTAEFANEIGKGNLEADFDLLSNKDVLGKSLLEMRDSLRNAKTQENNRKIEDEKQNWATQGIAKFGDILRQNNDDIHEFSYHIISNLVKYINANQGGLFLINDDDKNDVFIELLATYAYEKRKYIDKRIELGVGLIGRCVQEQKTIFMTELPESYINITSGLGKAVPNSLLIIPLKVNDEIFGVIELAGFNEFESHIIKFVEQVGENIAATISTTKINIRTNQLLEQSQLQSEEMAAQEEEMRQNMEELQATQEEADRRSSEMQGLLNALNTANLVIEYDLYGKILTVNDNYLKLVDISREQIVGSHHSDNMGYNKEELKANEEFWNDLRNGIAKKETNTVKFHSNKHTFVETYTPIFDENGNPKKVLKIATDITEFVK